MKVVKLEHMDTTSLTFKIKPPTPTQESIIVLKRLTDILIAEFSYDGEDPHGLKVYQEDVDKARELIERLWPSNFNIPLPS